MSAIHDFVLGSLVVEAMQAVPRGEQPPQEAVAARKKLVMLASSIFFSQLP
tara:strand:- start:535 stop:687 length:153 start_codon:yes stop_codon:yes gene_type:complete